MPAAYWGKSAGPWKPSLPEEWNAIFAVNVSGAFYLCQAVAPGMKAARFGRIVNISSGAGLTISLTGIQAYAAAKAALISLTRQLGHELGAWADHRQLHRSRFRAIQRQHRAPVGSLVVQTASKRWSMALRSSDSAPLKTLRMACCFSPRIMRGGLPGKPSRSTAGSKTPAPGAAFTLTHPVSNNSAGACDRLVQWVRSHLCCRFC